MFLHNYLILLLPLILVAFIISFSHCDSKVKDMPIETFDVKPGGVKHTMEISRSGVTCTFTYVCQGGTNEKWKMAILMIYDKDVYGCFVERESGTSYLFFQSYSLTASGDIEALRGQAFGNQNRPLQPTEYKFDKNAKTITEGSGFGAQLARVTLEYSLLSPRSDL